MILVFLNCLFYKSIRNGYFRSPGGNTSYFDIVAGVLQGNTLPPCLFIICQYYALRTSIDLMKETVLSWQKKKQKIPRTKYYGRGLRRWHSIPNKFTHPNEAKYMCFNEIGDISKLKGGPLKLVDKFTYLGSCVSSNETDINTWLAWTAIERLSFLPTPQLGQDMTQGQFLSGVYQVWIQSFPSPRLVASPRLKNLVCPTIYPYVEGE